MKIAYETPEIIRHDNLREITLVSTARVHIPAIETQLHDPVDGG